MRQWMLGMVLVVSTLGGVGTAQADYYDGLRAADAGRHSDALREWQAAANADDAKAMLALGRLYVQGLGVPQDYVQAHKWFNLAASRGEAEAVTERDARWLRAWRPNRWPRLKNERQPGSRNPPSRRLPSADAGSAGQLLRRKPSGRRNNSWRSWAMSRTRTGNGASARSKPIRRSCVTRTCR